VHRSCTAHLATIRNVNLSGIFESQTSKPLDLDKPNRRLRRAVAMFWESFDLNEDVQRGNSAYFQPNLFRPTELNLTGDSGWFDTRFCVLDQDRHVDHASTGIHCLGLR
jgi:hypothetical protein